jgi:hypothetical protein
MMPVAGVDVNVCSIALALNVEVDIADRPPSMSTSKYLIFAIHQNHLIFVAESCINKFIALVNQLFTTVMALADIKPNNLLSCQMRGICLDFC